MESAFLLTSPQDIEELAALRDRLGNHLAAVDRNTAAMTNWLTANKSTIIFYHQQLNRALANGDSAEAISLLAQMEGGAGLVLHLQDFRAKSEIVFGKNNPFQKAATGISDALPIVQESLPEIPAADLDLLSRFAAAPLPAEGHKRRSPLSGLFHRREQREEEKTQDIYRQLRAVKTDILSLRSERHYYIDSFMDWAGDTLTEGKADNSRMLQYQNPAHVIRLAEADRRVALKNDVEALRTAVLQYSELAEAIDRQDAHAVLEKIDLAWPAVPTQASALFQKILLHDYQSTSLQNLVEQHIPPGRQGELIWRLRHKAPGAFPRNGKTTFLERLKHALSI